MEVVERAFLRFAEIIEHGAGGANRLGVGRAVGEAEAIEPDRAKVLGQHLPCRLLKRPRQGGG